ncbi:TonB-dependent receptor [Flavobacterium sedimenticola]|uniref:TonB-dependent receptor n=1 Tax=Flavobacterium sedimenticola TaxID=3043286 RepID=A0ABT6XS87_9FLAO|nr:TonB-dependent receptor [Flavobacterium sedimenticola]MDI9257967.1 TonB-dependent receptor [Flavobacterium sedimenticola]
MKTVLSSILLLLTLISFGQNGVIKGKITDKQSETPLPGAIITLENVVNAETTSDADGNFQINNVPLGRQLITVRYIGYMPVTVPNIEVTSGKEVFLTIVLTENFNALDEVVIKAEAGKVKAINKMAAVSARQFSLEEVNRYAGGRSDVARLVANFAGVSTANDSRNDIVVRGNSPAGMLWRIEGIPVPSPNHFATLGTTGSPVSALNPNLLANSDFLTSAFPAEYGNAISGVFDLNFRKGNTEKYEFMVGVGAYPGAEFMAEGPLGKKGGSFVVAGRYGIAGYLGGAGTGTAIPNYNDIAFNADFGKTKWGTFAVYGIAGISNIEFLGKDAEEDDLFSAKDANQELRSDFGVLGVSHKLFFNQKTFIKTNLSVTGSSNKYDEERIYNLDTPTETTIPFTASDNTENRVTFSSYLNSKINKKITLKSGVLLERFAIDYSLNDRDRQEDADGDGYPDFNSIYNTEGNYTVFQPYTQGQFRLTETLVLNAGLHGQLFSVTNEFVLEPRTSLTYSINAKNSINLGYGIHHQNVPAPILFQNENVNGSLVQTNRHLDLVRSQHFVMGYDIKLADKWRGKLEVYYQYIDKAAVENFDSSYSSLTEGSDFGYSTDKTSLVSKGRGVNQGIELTLEKFFSKGYHALFTTSLFQSKYEGSDGVERNSPFNNQYVINALGGKEFKMGKRKKNTFSLDGKVTAAGGRFYTPVDLAASQAAGYEIKENDKAFSLQYDPYFRLDLRMGFKFNSSKKKQSHLLYLELQNVTDNNNIFINRYNRLTNQVNRIDQIGFFPDFGYKFQF